MLVVRVVHVEQPRIGGELAEVIVLFWGAVCVLFLQPRHVRDHLLCLVRAKSPPAFVSRPVNSMPTSARRAHSPVLERAAETLLVQRVVVLDVTSTGASPSLSRCAGDQC